MYEEPYRWVEAVGNRRRYLDEQFMQGSPVVALNYADGILLLTVSRGTPKLYEIYDRIALGGMGHPADLEKLRFSILEMAHVEGFNRSPSDVTGSRLVKYGLAPVIKQAFEEIFKAPFIVKILLAEIGLKREKDVLLTINYDGSFEECTGSAALAATPAVQNEMRSYLDQVADRASANLQKALGTALQAWAVGSLAQGREEQESDDQAENKTTATSKSVKPVAPEMDRLMAHLRETLAEKAIECAVLERNAPGSSKYRTLRTDELTNLLPKTLQTTAK